MAEGSFTYFNKNNGDVATYPQRHARLEFLQNWVTVEDEGHLADLQAEREGTRSGRGNLLGSSNVGDRIEQRHQVQDSPLSTTIGTASGIETGPVDPAVIDPESEPTTADPKVEEKPTPDPEPTPEPDPTPTPLDPADRPARSATKSEWVDWAVKAGASREEAESMTKTDLIEVYGE